MALEYNTDLILDKTLLPIFHIKCNGDVVRPSLASAWARVPPVAATPVRTQLPGPSLNRFGRQDGIVTVRQIAGVLRAEMPS